MKHLEEHHKCIQDSKVPLDSIRCCSRLHVFGVFLKEIINTFVTVGKTELFKTPGFLHGLNFALEDSGVLERASLDPLPPSVVGNDHIIGSLAQFTFLGLYAGHVTSFRNRLENIRGEE